MTIRLGTYLFVSLTVVFGVHSVNAEIVKKSVAYTDESGQALEGYLVYEDSASPKARPGVIVVHDWRGISEETKRQTEKVASLGYVAFAADVYGKGIRPKAPKESGEVSTMYRKDRALFRLRERAAFKYLREQPQVDPTRVAAIGYCFGGSGVIEMARDGLPLAGVVSFHGSLDSSGVSNGKSIRTKVLALCGADDPFVPASDMEAFEKELRENKVDYQIVKYGGAVHSFTDQTAKGEIKGAQYNAEADHRSWEAMKDFLQEVFR